MEDKNIFPTIRKGIENLIEDEEGNIPGNKLAVIGAMVVVLGSLMSVDAFARGHGSHSSHSSHSSGSGGYTYHSSHESHQSHQSGIGHSNTTPHSNTAPRHTNMTPHSNALPHSNASVHSNASHTSGGFDNVPSAHSAKGLPGKVAVTPENGFGLPDASGLQTPKPTPDTGVIPTIAATPSDTDNTI